MNEPLVLLHGFTGSPESWNDVLVRLPTRPARCPLLLGHGAAANSVKTFEDEVDRLAEGLSGSPVHLAGYSLGARLALGIAVRHPARVARLTLIGVHPGLAGEDERDARRRADARWIELLETCGIEAFVDAWGAQPLFASERRLPDAVRRRRHEERLRHDPKELARSLRVTGLAEMPDFRPHVAGVRVPVLLVTGELDPKFSALAEELSHVLPRARHTIVSGAGHALLLERPDLVATELA
jgi:2-succinyl-6-hydroxy-2,4-cyclohexadiene-1-carboxylate synthase